MTLYAVVRETQGMFIAKYRDQRLYMKIDHLDVLMPFPRLFIDAVPMLSLDYLLYGSEFENVHYSSLVKCAIGCQVFVVE